MFGALDYSKPNNKFEYKVLLYSFFALEHAAKSINELETWKECVCVMMKGEWMENLFHKQHYWQKKMDDITFIEHTTYAILMQAQSLPYTHLFKDHPDFLRHFVVSRRRRMK